MRVMIIGGVLGRDEAYRRSINPTPEMTLAAGLRRRGVDVVTAPHSWLHSLAGVDVVHVHHLGKSVPALAAARPLRRIPLVFTRHGQEENLSATRLAALRLVYRTADCVIALSDQEAALLRYQVRGQVVVIRNGIDGPSHVVPPTQLTMDKNWRLLFVGQLIPLKNVDVLLCALAAIRPQVMMSLRLVYHNSELLEQLQSLARQLGIADAVTFVGGRDAAGLAEEYRLTDVVVLPSATEALPTVVTESLLAQKPVVATAVGGIPEQVQDGGILVTPGDAQELAAGLLQLTGNYESYVVAARRRSAVMRREYSVEGMIDGHAELYAALLADHRDRGRRLRPRAR